MNESVKRLVLALSAGVLSIGCSEGSTAPTGPPSVAGLYQHTELVAAATCTPQTPPAGGTVVLAAFSYDFPVRIIQQGSQLTFVDPAFPAEPELTGSIDQDGDITASGTLNFTEDPRAGDRIFVVNLTLTHTLRVVANGTRITGNGSYVNVFREGSTTAPVFATCSRTSSITMTRIGN